MSVLTPITDASPAPGNRPAFLREKNPEVTSSKGKVVQARAALEGAVPHGLVFRALAPGAQPGLPTHFRKRSAVGNIPSTAGTSREQVQPPIADATAPRDGHNACQGASQTRGSMDGPPLPSSARDVLRAGPGHPGRVVGPGSSGQGAGFVVMRVWEMIRHLTGNRPRPA